MKERESKYWREVLIVFLSLLTIMLYFELRSYNEIFSNSIITVGRNIGVYKEISGRGVKSKEIRVEFKSKEGKIYILEQEYEGTSYSNVINDDSVFVIYNSKKPKNAKLLNLKYNYSHE